MKVDELSEAAAATARRVDALLGEGEDTRELDDATAAVIFAGMDVPALEVLETLEFNAQMHAAHVEGFGVETVLKAVQVHAFLFGFECARRTETDRRVP